MRVLKKSKQCQYCSGTITGEKNKPLCSSYNSDSDAGAQIIISGNILVASVQYEGMSLVTQCVIDRCPKCGRSL